jgi:hypothetical protein
MIPKGDERDRKMILDPYAWPLPYLCLKRYAEPNSPPECGIIHPDSLTVRTHDNETIKSYETVDELMDDGWMVD